MWSSVRRYRGRNNRDDDFTFTCSCVTDLCFTWCSNQCSKKQEQRSSLSSQTSNESEQTRGSKCCTFGNCLVRTTQVTHNDQGSQVLQEDYTDPQRVDWDSQHQVIEADPEKAETSRENENESGYWAFLRRLRRFRPRFFEGRTTITAVATEIKDDVPKLSGLQRLGLWFRQLGHRVEFASHSPQNTISPSAVIAEELREEADITETNEGQIYPADDIDRSPWSDPFIVFAKGQCGYESFDPNCCRLWQTINYSLSEERNVTDVRYNSTALEEKRPQSASRDFKVPDVVKPGCKRPVDHQKPRILSDPSVQKMTSVTMITVASELETHTQKRIMGDSSVDKDTPHGSKQTQVHTPDVLDKGRELTEIEKSEFTRDMDDLIGPATPDSIVTKPAQSVTSPMTFQPKIPEVILTRAATPDTRSEEECARSSVVNKAVSKPLQRQGAVDSDSPTKANRGESQNKNDQGDNTVKADILNFMIKSSPKRVPSPRIRIETSKSLKQGAGSSDVRKKIVRFKEPSFSHSTTKGRAVYIGTSKHTSAPKREIIDCLSMTVERRRVTVEETKVSGNVSFQDTNPIRSVLDQSHSQAPGDSEQAPPDSSGSPKGVKEYVNEYSELCKASVDQERQILQTVIDSVRECYKMPTSTEDKKETNQKEN